MAKRNLLLTAGMSVLMACGAAGAQTTPAVADASNPEAIWQQKVETWRAQRERELTAPNGWLTLIGLDWLKPGINSFGGANGNSIRIHATVPDRIGFLTVAGTTVQLLAPSGGFPAGLTLDGKPAREGPLSADDNHPSIIAWHEVTMSVLPRGGRYALRIKDAASAARSTFRGLHWFSPDLHYAVEAKWIPFNSPHSVKLPTAAGSPLNLPAPGMAEFTFAGQTLRLEPVLEDPHDTTLFFVVRDKTSGEITYDGGRFLRTSFPDHGLNQPGTLVLDFNQLFNPPCAYTAFATCPLAPDVNRLPIAIDAGEQQYSR